MTVRILQLTDLHLFRDPDARLKGIPTRELLVDVISHVKEAAGEIDHVIVTGDHTHDELPESYEAVRGLLSPWMDRLRQVPGNHDDRAVLSHVFTDRMQVTVPGRIQFHFTADNWLCAGLDTHSPGEVSGQIEQSQMDWLSQLCRQYPDHQVALFMHHPPLDLNSIWMDRIGLKNRELLHDLVGSTPRIRLICCGHVHHESTRSLHQAIVVTTPATGIQFDPAGKTPTFVRQAPGFRMIELDGHGFMTRVFRLPEARFAPFES